MIPKETEEEIEIYNKIIKLVEIICNKNKLKFSSWSCGSKNYGLNGCMNITVNFCGDIYKPKIRKQIDNFENLVSNSIEIKKHYQVFNGFGKGTIQVIFVLK